MLKGYCDTSWIISSSDNKSISWCMSFLLGGGSISWASKKQTCISHSTMKLEFIAMDASGKEVAWLRNILLDIKLWPQPMSAISLYCDYDATMSRAYSNINNGKSRHISIRHGYVQELISNEVITIVYVKFMNNLADLLIKKLYRDMVRKTTSGMRLKLVIKDTGNGNLTSD